MQVRPQASLSGRGIQQRHELWYRPQMCLGSGVIVAVAPMRLLAWEVPYAAGAALKSKKKKKKEREREKEKRTRNFISFKLIQV